MLRRGIICCLLLGSVYPTEYLLPRTHSNAVETTHSNTDFTVGFLRHTSTESIIDQGEYNLRKVNRISDVGLWAKLERGETLLNNRLRNVVNIKTSDINIDFYKSVTNENVVFLRNSDAYNTVPTTPTVKDLVVGYKNGKRINDEDPVTSLVMRFRREMGHTGTVECKPFEEVDFDKRTFYSPGYPNNYPGNTDCVVVLEAAEGQLLRLDFRDKFNIEKSDECRFDFLEIRDGAHGYSNLIGQFCGEDFPPIVTSSGRHLWLHFRSDENIEYSGFTAVFEYIPRPTTAFNQVEQTCIINTSGDEGLISRANISEDIVRASLRYDVPLDCMWIITVKPGWKIQLAFNYFVLKKPNDCDSNFLDIFSDRTDLPSRLKNFCGSMADAVVSKGNILFVRFLADPTVINSTFEALYTAFRDKGAGESCAEDEYDCEDATCISGDLRCNGQINCRFKWDEDECKTDKGSSLMQSEHIVIIMVIFSLILSGMSFVFVFRCIKKLIDDHKIIQENIRQSREADLDEIEKPVKIERPKGAMRSLRHSRSLSDESLQVAFDLPCHVPGATITAELTHDNDNSKGSEDTSSMLHSAHKNNKHNEFLAQKQNNNVKMRDHSTETTDEIDAIIEEETQPPDTCESACQTRESLFQTSPVHCDSERSGNYGWRNVFTPVSLPRGHSGSTVRHMSSLPSSGNSTKDCYKAEAVIEMESQESKPHYEDIRTRRPSSVGTTRSAPDVIIVSAPPAR